MTADRYAFDRFVLDIGDRQLRRDDLPVDVNARYLDALALLVANAGKLVSKDRFLDEVWRGVPVTDEALTQCIKTLRRLLGDSASAPRLIETVPKHGYRFIGAVEPVAQGWGPQTSSVGVKPAGGAFGWREFVSLGGAGTVGGGMAGLIGGLIYGFGGASQPLAPGMGAASVLLVLLCLTILLAAMGGAGVGFGIAAAGFARSRAWQWSTFGGALGGLFVGGAVKLLGIDAFNLLLGQSPGDITGAAEGIVLGGAVGLAAWIGQQRATSLRRCAIGAAAIGALAGTAIVLLGGRLMGGSLELLAQSFPGSRLRLDHVGALFGERGFGPVSEAVTGALEGGLFAGCVVAAMNLGRRSLGLDWRSDDFSSDALAKGAERP